MVNTENRLLQWERYLKNKYRNSKIIEQRISEIRILSASELPVIIDFAHLSQLLGIKKHVLGGLVNSAESFYRSFEIPKKRGGHRKIEAPYPILLDVQRWIKSNILDVVPLSDVAHGFVYDRSIVSHAKQHVGKEYLLKIDLKNFFPTITQDQIYFLFRHLGYSKEVSFLLASICSYKGSLPQGAATSPALSNVLLKSMDASLFDIASKNEISFSRYADDLAFSGKEITQSFIDQMMTIITDAGFDVNHKKTQLRNSISRKLLTGIEISGGKITIPRALKRKLRQEVYFVSKFGLLNHLENQANFDPIFLERLLGKLSFWKHVDPTSTYAREAIDSVNKLRRNELDKPLGDAL